MNEYGNNFISKLKYLFSDLIKYIINGDFHNDIISYLRRASFNIEYSKLLSLINAFVYIGFFSTLILFVYILFLPIYIFYMYFVNIDTNLFFDLAPNIYSELLVILSSMFITAVLVSYYRNNIKVIADYTIIKHILNIKDIIIPLYNIDVTLDIFNAINNVFVMPNYDKTLLEVNFGDLISHFRSSNKKAYSLPSYTLKSIFIDNNAFKFKLGIASFVDIWYYQYNNTPILKAPHRERESNYKYSNQTLKSLLSPIVYNYYLNIFTNYLIPYDGILILDSLDKYISSNSLFLYPHIPNALGITGIIEFSYKGDLYYFVQFRNKSNVDPAKIQWSYAGLVSHYADHTIAIKEGFIDASDTYSIAAEKFGAYEIYEEVIPYIESVLGKIAVSKNEIKEISNNIINSGNLLGLILNSDMLFQPELVVMHQININDNVAELLIKNLFIEKAKLNNIDKSGLYIINSDTVKSLCLSNNKNIRHIFKLICILVKRECNNL